jgi:hypothetical protein
MERRGRRGRGVREGGGDGGGPCGREGPEADGGADDDAQRALRPDHQRGEVVARDALHGAVPGVDDAAVGEHDREREHGLARDPVLRAQQAAGVGGDVAADGRDGLARGIRRVPEPEGRERGVEVVVEDAGLHHGELVGLADLEDPVHAAHRQHDLARGGRRAAREAGAGAARDDGGAGGARDAQGRDDVLHLGRADDRDRPRGAAVAGPVGARVVEGGGVGGDDVAEGPDELGADGVGVRGQGGGADHVVVDHAIHPRSRVHRGRRRPAG